MEAFPESKVGVQTTLTPPRLLELDEDYSALSLGETARQSRTRHLLVGLGAAFLLVALVIALFFVNLFAGLFGTVSVGSIITWIVFGVFHYRAVRQDEVLQVLTTAIESQLPLHQALMVYVKDRPHGVGREIWLTLLLPGYYWIWHRKHAFDRRVEQLAKLLAMGVPLFQALRDVPAVASRETVMAAVIGQKTGQMVVCLRHASRRRFATLWIELVPRLLYPLVVFGFVSFALVFLTIFILPKFQKIFKDFNLVLPRATRALFDYRDLLLPLVWSCLGLVGCILGIILFSTTIRWNFPLLRWPYRRLMQSRLLHMLGVLLDSGRPLPQALELLMVSGYFPPVVVDKLRNARLMLERGEPLGPTLASNQLLPPSMAPLIQAAERNKHLPTALKELGEHLGNRAIQLVRHLVMVLSPVGILMVAVLVALVVIGMFLPLIKLLEALTK